jgi:NADPH:quinone reductase-like Zn-dependent oxidoreductase
MPRTLTSGEPSSPTGPVAFPVTADAVVHTRYGGDRPLRIGAHVIDGLEPDEALVRVHATSVNPADWYGVQGFALIRIGNGLRRPNDPRVGTDLAGRVVAVGDAVTSLRVGDDVFGTGAGTWAEFAVAREGKLARKPAGVSFEDAAALPVAATTALQAVRDCGGVGSDTRVLVNGASGGVGPFAVQLARSLGAHVTAVCSTPNVETVRSLGAERVVDYRQEDFCALGQRYDVLIDVAGSRPLRSLRRILTRNGRIVLVGAPMTARGLGPLPHLAATKLSGALRRRSVAFFVARVNTADLDVLARLLDEGTVRVVADRRVAGLAEIPEALRRLGEGHARGKIVVRL